MTDGDAPTRRRPGLSRDRIVAAALEIARAEGLTVLTMRRLAAVLHTAPMSLYRHVGDREDLLLGMLDVCAAELHRTLPPPADDPADDLVGVMTAAHAVFGRDAWIIDALVVDGLASPLILPVAERVLANLERAGLTGADAASCYALLWEYLYGETISRHNGRPDDYARRMTAHAIADTTRFPSLSRIAATSGERPDFFAANIRRLVRGLVP